MIRKNMKEIKIKWKKIGKGLERLEKGKSIISSYWNKKYN